jgi:hypothetical protein
MTLMTSARSFERHDSCGRDLRGQAASESAGHRHISGTGGQSQFVRGAYASKGGKSFICMSSTYERHGVRESRIGGGHELSRAMPERWPRRRLSGLGYLAAECVQGDCVGLRAAATSGVQAVDCGDLVG